MDIRLPKQQDVLDEAVQMLWQNMPVSKVALVISMWFSEGSDYLKVRDDLFGEKTVVSLALRIEDFQRQSKT